jgi:hypothetical protein
MLTSRQLDPDDESWSMIFISEVGDNISVNVFNNITDDDDGFLVATAIGGATIIVEEPQDVAEKYSAYLDSLEITPETIN